MRKFGFENLTGLSSNRILSAEVFFEPPGRHGEVDDCLQCSTYDRFVASNFISTRAG